MGGDYLTKDGKSAINSPAWVKSLEWYAGMLRRYAPPGVVNFNWYECSSAFMQGQVGIYYDGVNFAGQFEDNEKSKIAGKVGYTVLPGGPAGHFAPTYTNAMAVSAQSQEQGGGLSPDPVGHDQEDVRARAVERRRCGPGLALERPRGEGQAQDAGRLVYRLPGQPEDRARRAARDRGRHAVPGHLWRGHPEGHRRR